MEDKLTVESDPDGLTLIISRTKWVGIDRVADAAGLYRNITTVSEDRVRISNDDLAKVLNHALGLLRTAQERSARPGPSLGSDAHFDAFWALYPAKRRVDKKNIHYKWRLHRLDAEWPAIEKHLQSQIPEWASEAFKYCPLVTTYVNQRRWEVEVEPEQPLI